MEQYTIGKPGRDENRKWKDVKPLLKDHDVKMIEAQQREARQANGK